MDTAEQLHEKKDKNDGPPVSVIGADIVIKGDLTASYGLQMEGRITGDIHCTTLIIGEKGTVEGKIRAERVRVLGTVDGGVETKDLAVEAAGRVSGEITYARLKVANGGTIQGTMTCVAQDAKAADAGRLKLVEPAAAAAPEQPPKPSPNPAGHVYIE